MLIEIMLTIIIGIIFGTLTGLIPGLHINLVGVFIITLSVSLLSKINEFYLVVFIVAMAITHTFIDFIPSILLGCPDTDTELSTLPGHELLKKGQGYGAIILTLYGSIAAIFILVLIAVPSSILISKTYEFIQNLIPYFLILISIILITIENKKINSLIVFILTGFLGLTVLNFQNLKEPLLPLLTGLFGSSMLILSIKNKTKVEKQKIQNPKTKLKKPLLGALIASPICSFLPGLGAGQAAIIGNTLFKTDKKGFLVLLGATNTLVMGFSFISLYLISRTRTGAALAINELIGKPTTEILILIMVVVVITGIFSFYLTKNLAKFFSKKINKINYTKISYITLIFLGIIVILISGFLGFLVFIVSTFTGIYSISLKVRRTNMMGCLLVPTIIFYLF